MSKFIDPLDNPEPFRIPDQYFEQLNEMSPGGWILFSCDSHGTPQVNANFQHQIMEMGLRSFAAKFLQGISVVEDAGMAQNIHKENEEQEENDDEE